MGNTVKAAKSTTHKLQPLTLGVSKDMGFLPQAKPIGTFATTKFAFLDVMANKWLSSKTNRIGKQELDTDIGKMETLDITQTQDMTEIRRIYSVITLLSHLYVWQDVNSPKQVLPRCLSVPLLASAKKLGLAPVLTHAAVDLYNWKLINDSAGWHMENLKCWHTMTGTDDEEWFYLIMTLVEYHTVVCIDQGLLLLKELSSDSKLGPDSIKIASYLAKMAEAIKLMTQTVARMNEKCRPEIFFHVLRPYLGGWDSKSKFPNGGLGYTEMDGKIKVLSYVGGSAAQSSAIQFLDRIFEVKHSGHALEFLTKMLDYMPADHKTFLLQVEHNVRTCSIARWLQSQTSGYTFTPYTDDTATSQVKSNPKYVGTGGTSFEIFLEQCQWDTTGVLAMINQMRTIDANIANCLKGYSHCIRELAGFRAAHYKLVHDYIVKQM